MQPMDAFPAAVLVSTEIPPPPPTTISKPKTQGEQEILTTAVTFTTITTSAKLKTETTTVVGEGGKGARITNVVNFENFLLPIAITFLWTEPS